VHRANEGAVALTVKSVNGSRAPSRARVVPAVWITKSMDENNLRRHARSAEISRISASTARYFGINRLKAGTLPRSRASAPKNGRACRCRCRRHHAPFRKTTRRGFRTTGRERLWTTTVDISASPLRLIKIRFLSYRTHGGIFTGLRYLSTGLRVDLLSSNVFRRSQHFLFNWRSTDLRCEDSGGMPSSG